MRLLRRICQFSALAVLLALPVISRGGALYDAFGPGASHVRDLATPWEYALYVAFSWTFGVFADPVAAGDLFQGGYWSITLFGYTINDPLAVLGHAAATLSVHWPLLAGALIPIVAAAFAGRLFCGWACPINTLLELNMALRRWIERRLVRLHLPRMMLSTRAGYLVLAGGLLVSMAGAFNVFPLILPYVTLAREWHLGVYGIGFGFGVVFLVVLMAVELVLAPRLWCRSLCPTGLVLGLIGRLRPLGILRLPERSCATNCSLCIAVCPVGVNPRDGVATEQCMMCNECVARCPVQILEIGVAAPRRRRRLGGAAGAALMLMLTLMFGATAAEAHHISGLPHYGYLENYPQTPTEEVQVSAPPYRVTVVAYALEGLDSASSETPDDVMVYVSIRDVTAGKAYSGRIDVGFRPVGGPLGGSGGDGTVTRAFTAPMEETVYRMRIALPAPVYDVVIRMGGEGGTRATLRLPLRSGPSLAGLAATLAVIAAAALAIAFLFMRRRARMARGAVHDAAVPS